MSDTALWPLGPSGVPAASDCVNHTSLWVWWVWWRRMMPHAVTCWMEFPSQLMDGIWTPLGIEYYLKAQDTNGMKCCKFIHWLKSQRLQSNNTLHMFLEEESRHRKTPKFSFPIFLNTFSPWVYYFMSNYSWCCRACVWQLELQTIEAHLSHEQACKRGQIGSLE